MNWGWVERNVIPLAPDGFFNLKESSRNALLYNPISPTEHSGLHSGGERDLGHMAQLKFHN